MNDDLCRKCGAVGLVARPYTYLIEVDGITVRDDTEQALHCDNCGAVRLTMAEIEAYERRAAAEILRTVDKASGKMVRYARRAMGLTQEHLAALLQCASETISRWENDRAVVERHHQLALVALLDTAVQHRLDSESLLRFMRAGVTELNIPTIAAKFEIGVYSVNYDAAFADAALELNQIVASFDALQSEAPSLFINNRVTSRAALTTAAREQSKELSSYSGSRAVQDADVVAA